MTPKQIKVEYSDDSIFGHADPDDEGIDAQASRALFEENLIDAFYDEYPEAEVEFVHGINDRHSADGRRNTTDAENVGDLINKVWESWEWLAYTDED